MDVNAESFGYVTGLKNSSCNEVSETDVTRSQPNGKDNTKIKYIVDGLLVENLRNNQP